MLHEIRSYCSWIGVLSFYTLLLSCGRDWWMNWPPLCSSKKPSPRFSCFHFYSFSGICVIYSSSFPKLLLDLTRLFLFQVPRIYWELSTSRVLLMEFMEGGQVNDRAYMERNGINVNEVASQPSLNWACWAVQNWFWPWCKMETNRIGWDRRISTQRCEGSNQSQRSLFLCSLEKYIIPFEEHFSVGCRTRKIFKET